MKAFLSEKHAIVKVIECSCFKDIPEETLMMPVSKQYAEFKSQGNVWPFGLDNDKYNSPFSYSSAANHFYLLNPGTILCLIQD